jgi:hypothetical protein
MLRILKLMVLSTMFGSNIAASPASAQHWCAPVNVGSGVNSAFQENYPSISPDGLAMYFDSNRPGGLGNTDIWVSRRATTGAPWGSAINVTPLNSVAMEKGLFVFSRDGLTIYFASARAGGFGGLDIHVANRVDPDDDLGWTTPVNLGPDVNTPFQEAANGWYLNGNQSKVKRFLFVRSDGTQDPSPTQAENFDLFAIRQKTNGNQHDELVEELSSIYRETAFTLSPNQLEVFFSSTRPPSAGGLDLWTSTRFSIEDPWGWPMPMEAVLNTIGRDETGTIDPSDLTGNTLYIFSNRAGTIGGADVFVTTRTCQ